LAAKNLYEQLGPDAVLSDSTLTLAAHAHYTNPIRLNPGTLESVQSTRGLGLFRNERLRNELTAWSQQVEALDKYEEYFLLQVNIMVDYLSPRYSLMELDRKLSRTQGRLDLSFQNNVEGDFTPVMRDMYYANMIYGQYYLASVYLNRLNELKEQLLVIQGILESESRE